MLNSLSILPLSPVGLERGIKDALNCLSGDGMSDEEGLLKLGFDFDKWLEAEAGDGGFPPSLRPVLSAADWRHPGTGGNGLAYGKVVDRVSRKFSMTRREAAIVLTQLPLVLRLATDFRSSPARIALLLQQTEARIPVGWRLVETVLSDFRIPSELDPEAVAGLLEQDRLDSENELMDSTVETMVERMSEQSADVGLDGEFCQALRHLFLAENEMVPYFQILLYICSIDHFYDHPPEFIYNFNPRGAAATRIFATFPEELAPGGNPVLNNFKAVDRITPDWAESRKSSRDQARALVRIIGGLSSLAHSPRTRISTAIRMAIFRYISIKTPASISIAPVNDIESMKRFVRRVAGSPTGTRGVIEQRLSDFLASFDLHHPSWRPRGLGDPVNASNSASRKLGDSDFQNIGEKTCVAIEAHAGRLTDIYVKEHIRTLRLNLPARLKEWLRISDLENWQLTLRFLVHENGTSGQKIDLPDGVSVRIEVLTYGQYFESLLARMETDIATTIYLFNRWISSPLDARNTPIATKRKAVELLGE